MKITKDNPKVIPPHGGSLFVHVILLMDNIFLTKQVHYDEFKSMRREIL